MNLHANFMGEKIIIRFWWESGLSSAFRNHLTTFCRSFAHCACSRLCFTVGHFIQNNCLYFFGYCWSEHALTALATLPVSVAWQNCCSRSKTAVIKIEAFSHLTISQQGKRKTTVKVCLTSMYIEKNKSFLAYVMRILKSCEV